MCVCSMARCAAGVIEKNNETLGRKLYRRNNGGRTLFLSIIVTKRQSRTTSRCGGRLTSRRRHCPRRQQRGKKEVSSSQYGPISSLCIQSMWDNFPPLIAVLGKGHRSPQSVHPLRPLPAQREALNFYSCAQSVSGAGSVQFLDRNSRDCGLRLSVGCLLGDAHRGHPHAEE